MPVAPVGGCAKDDDDDGPVGINDACNRPNASSYFFFAPTYDGFSKSSIGIFASSNFASSTCSFKATTCGNFDSDATDSNAVASIGPVAKFATSCCCCSIPVIAPLNK